ncbi:MAG: TonB-dependent receptor [Pedobacter sp.]|nr:MAG: TonB-dependent receptor [Pedobacter sp.]
MRNQLFHKCLFFILTISICYVKVFAQTSSGTKITGKIIDAELKEGIPFASAILLDKATQAIVKAVQSDVDGVFVIPAVNPGTYTFKASYVGYANVIKDPITITATQVELKLGDLIMRMSDANTLQEVSVTAPKPTMQMGIDKKIFSVEQSLVSEGGSAADVLQNVPSVQTDMEGNVSLRGSSGVRVLIDGKPSLIAGGNIAQILQSIPASSIESVELITNPSAKYDAEGQGGIINIVLKRNKKLGFNGSASLTAGSRENYNGNTNLSFQNKNINLFANYSYRDGNRVGDGSNSISYLGGSNSTAFASQLNDSRSQDRGHNVKAGIDYFLAEKSVISFSGGFNIRNNNRSEGLNIGQFDGQRNPLQLSNRLNSNLGKGNSYDLNLDFTQKFKKPNEELSVGFNYSQGSNENNQRYGTDVYFDNGSDINPISNLQQIIGDGNNNNFNAQLDYVKPLGKFGKIETGFRSQHRKSDNLTMADQFDFTNQAFTFLPALSNGFNSKENINAAYFNYQNQINNFGYQVGLRFEDAELETRLATFDALKNQTFTPGRVAYTRLYPSIYLSQKLNNDQQLQLNYSRRVNRPRGWDTNPFLNVSDPLNHSQGNANLKPEDVHAFELGYSKYFRTFSIVSSLYLRQTNDVIQRIRTEPDENGITLTTPQNLTRNTASGLELIGKFDVIKAWNFTTNFNFYQSKIQGVPAYGIVDNAGFSWNANMTHNFILTSGLSLQFKADYRAPEVMAQGTRKAMYGFDGGAKYDFPNKKSSLSLNVRDIFATRRWRSTTNGLYSVVENSRRMQGTMANLTYSYRFGKSTFNFKKNKKQDDQGPRSEEENF